MFYTHCVALGAALLVPFSACPSQTRNFGVSSMHQPVVQGDKAYVPGCPDWRKAGRDSAALTDSNYGCATNSNLAAMIANPADLLHGRDETATSGADVSNKAIKAWLTAEPTSKQWTPTVKENTPGGGK